MDSAISSLPAVRLRWRPLAIAAGLLLLVALLTRIAWGYPVLSDGSSTILAGWDFAHGNVLLHGWVVSDDSFYVLQIPVAALSALLVGASATAVHLTAGLVYTLVIACTLWCTSGPVIRRVLALAVLLAPLSNINSRNPLIAGVDHLGSSVFILLSALIMERLRGRWYAPWLLLMVLTLGGLSDTFIMYVGVIGVVGVCLWKALAERGQRWELLWFATAAVVSVGATQLVHRILRHFHGYAMTSLSTTVSPRSEWLVHLRNTWFGLRVLLGFAQPGAGLAGVCTLVLGWTLLALTVAGGIRTLRRWRTSHTAQQIAVLIVPGALAAYALSEISSSANSAYDLTETLPFCALLAANAFPDRWIIGRETLTQAVAGTVGAVTAVAVLAAVTQPATVTDPTGLIARLSALHLSYGLSDYPSASSTTVRSDQQVTVRPVIWDGGGFEVYNWETSTRWYSGAQHDARFFLTAPGGSTPAEVVQAFGKPSAEYQVGNDEVLVYSYNLLTRVAHPQLPTG